MAKRFTDTDKWKKVWFRELKPVHKCFWEYIRDNCNNAGIWEVDFKLASFQIGAKINQSEIEQAFEKQFIKVNSNKWFLTDFIEWQYNCPISELNPKNNAHLSALRILNKFDIEGLIEGLVRAQHAPMDKDKNKDKVKNKERGKGFIKPTKAELDAYCKKMNYGVNTERFLAHYTSNGWKVGKNPMKSWESALTNWQLRDDEDKGTHPKPQKSTARYYCPKCKKYEDYKGDIIKYNYTHSCGKPLEFVKFIKES